MYRIEYDNPEKIYRDAVEMMSASKEVYGVSTGFSTILDKEHGGDRNFIEGYCPDWITFCGEMQLRGYGRVISEIEWLESKIKSRLLELNMMAAFNDGDKEGLELCLKAMNGVISKAKLGIGKGESDRKNAETMLKVNGEKGKLEKYDTKELASMLKVIEEKEDGSK